MRATPDEGPMQLASTSTTDAPLTLFLLVWSGDSCPPAFDLAVDLDREGHGFSRGEKRLTKRTRPQPLRKAALG
jgi:hypothetical protein